MRRLRRVALAPLAGALGMLAFASPAAADTAQIGSQLNFPAVPALCNGCVAVQHNASSGLSPFPFKSPANGLVTSWSVRTDDQNALYALRILRQSGTTTYLSVGRSPATGPIPDNTDKIYTYATSLPISNGDNIGIEVTNAHDLPDHFTGNALDVDAWIPNLPDGTSGSFTGTPGHELLLQASVKYCNVPALKKLKTKAAKQALKAHDCLPKVKKSQTKKDKFRGKVLKQKVAPGTTALPGTTVPIVIGQK